MNVSSAATQQQYPDVLSFWRARANDFPHVACLARKILSVPASSSGVERSFSFLHKTLEPGRKNMEASTVKNVMLMDSIENMKII